MPGRRHEHCEKCYNTRCQLPLHITLSCVVVKCPKSCGSIFHQCKLEEHRLLCPNETVPCLNSWYGCPLRMTRGRLAKHLEVCPASVVCCSQEWNRWPAAESDLTFYQSVSENPGSVEDLDVATALRDQELLFQSIKMRNIFPELIQQILPQQDADGPDGPSEEVKEEKDEALGCCSRVCGGPPGDSSTMVGLKEVKELSQEEREALATSRSVESLQNYASWEKMFNKEKQGCQQTAKNLNRTQEEEKEGQRNSAVGAVPSVNGDSGWAPWQDGVLERLSKEATIAEYNMYLVHNGAMLINFGQLAACTPREKDFVYGSLEPIEVQSVHTFSVPTSYRAKRHHLKGPTRKTTVEHRGVDTADLGEPAGGVPLCHEVAATLLCCLERELKGHPVSESAGVDGLYVDVGTQTYSFAAAPFQEDASLADVVAGSGRPPRLHLQVQTESVTRRHNRSSSAFSYTCGRFFRRDEYRRHFRNVHTDIQASLGGWFQQRCPLAYLGCTYTQTRLEPAAHPAAIKFHGGATSFVLRPEVASSLRDGGEGALKGGGQGADPLSGLPLEVLQQIAAYLDSFTLSQLALVSRLMREVCATLLQDRGMVYLRWERKTYSHGGSSWRCRQKVWQFSSAFSSVDRWSFSNIPSMSDHLKSCSYYQREERVEPVALACLAEVKEKICGSKA